MAQLPYTDGSNGNGLTRVSDVLNYLNSHPLAQLDDKFIESYIPLFKNDKEQRMLIAMVIATISKINIQPPKWMVKMMIDRGEAEVLRKASEKDPKLKEFIEKMIQEILKEKNN